VEIKAEINLSESDQADLKKILKAKDTKLEEILAPYASAAIEEFVTMILGQKVFSRGTDIHEYRLYLLIKHAFSYKIPTEQEVSDLFQSTASRSRSLIRAVMSKYQYLLKDAVENTLKDRLNTVKIPDNRESVTVAIYNLNLVE